MVIELHGIQSQVECIATCKCDLTSIQFSFVENEMYKLCHVNMCQNGYYL